MLLAFRLLDVFAVGPFTGNQLCVVPNADGVQADTMQALAREIGFSETTFVTAIDDGGYDVRIFTPGSELPFAGHPTLGTAFLLAAEDRVPPTVTQRCEAGRFLVEVDPAAGRGRMRQSVGQVRPAFDDRAAVARAAGLSERDLHPDRAVRTITTGLPHTIVPVRDVATLRRAERRADLVAEVLRRTGGESLYLFAEDDDGVVARMFDSEHGVGEDPATGSAAGPLGVYLSEHRIAGMPGGVRVRQGEQVGRPSLIEVEIDQEPGGWVPWVGGAVRTVGEGGFLL